MPIEKSPARNGDLPVLLEGEEIRFSEPKTRPVLSHASFGSGC